MSQQDLSLLPVGLVVYVEFPGQLFAGMVIEQMPRDGWVRVETDAAKLIRNYWSAMSFRWADGLAAAGMGHGRLIVPQTQEEALLLKERVKAREREDAAKHARAHLTAGSHPEFWWQD